ncbi:MAG: hypothetical protein FWH48_07565 [Oscillospiraceae bacterium]|nr:hypothetical protein [Oscillospiraceae bacterium]
MPIFRKGEGNAPVWSELEAFYLDYVEKGQKKELKWRGPKERYIVIEGTVMGICDGSEYLLTHGQVFDPPIGKDFTISTEDGCAGICRCCGNWGNELGGSGLFGVTATDQPVNIGDPAEYERNASFDNHYHDCDEYWIIYQGGGVAYSEGERYEVGVGDCIATGRGYHHDFPICYEPIFAAFFETTLTGQKRIGHLWEHTHGKPLPDSNRK